jgi:transcriptional regulator with XRE-family HTH domain
MAISARPPERADQERLAGEGSNLGRLIAILRTARGWSQSALARASGVKRGSISEYESGAKTPDASTLERLLAAMGFEWAALDLARWFLGTLFPGESVSAGTAIVSALLREGAVEIGRTAARLGELTALLERGAEQVVQERELSESRAEEPASAAELWDRLRPLPAKRQESLVRTDAAFWSKTLCLLLCSESEKACAASPVQAVRLADLAIIVAERVGGESAWRSVRLKGFAMVHRGNALRVQGVFEQAEHAFAQADELWRSGEDAVPEADEGLFPAYKASLRRAQRRLDETLDLLAEAAALCRSPRLRAQIRVNQAKTHEERGDLEKAIEILETIEVPQGDGRLLLCVRHNLADNLSKVGRLDEAEALIPEVKQLARAHGRELDRVRLLWVEGRIAGGRGRTDEAGAHLTQVRGAFAAQELDFDTALVSLELASIYAGEGRTEEVKTIARHLVPIFQAKRVPAEALKALALFRQAAEQERATLELVSGLISFLRRARHDPGLSFAAER